MPSFLRSIPRPILIVSVISLILAPILSSNLLEILRGGEIFHWLWPYTPVPIVRGLSLLVSVIVYVAAGMWAARRGTRSAAIVAIIGGILLPYIVIGMRYDNPVLETFDRTVSGVVTGPHLLGSQIEWGNLDSWRDWPRVMDEYHTRSIHMAISPPGLPMFYGLLNQLFEAMPAVSNFLYERIIPQQCHNYQFIYYTHAEWASSWFGTLMPLWATITLLPLFRIARRMTNSTIARWLMLFWPILPGVAMMSPVWNIIYPMFCLFAFWLILIGLARRGPRAWLPLYGAGVIVSLLTFANLSLVPFILLCGLYVLLHWFFHERPGFPFGRPVMLGLMFGLGVLTIWVPYTLITGTTPFQIINRAFDAHFTLERPFLPWLYMHFWEWILFGSLPLALVWLLQAIKPPRGRNVLPLALLLSMIILLLSNTARGETGRVWLFFTPFVLLSAALWVHECLFAQRPQMLKNPAQMTRIETVLAPFSLRRFVPWAFESSPTEANRLGAIFAPLLIAQAAILLALAPTWDTMFAPDITPTPPPPVAAAGLTPTSIQFGDAFRLVGWQGRADGKTITFDLAFQSLRQLDRPYNIAILPVAPDGSTPISALVWQPHPTTYPTTCWRPDQIIGEQVTITATDALSAGDWWFSVRVFEDLKNPMNVLNITLPDGSRDTQAGIGPVTVQTP